MSNLGLFSYFEMIFEKIIRYLGRKRILRILFLHFSTSFSFHTWLACVWKYKGWYCQECWQMIPFALPCRTDSLPLRLAGTCLTSHSSRLFRSLRSIFWLDLGGTQVYGCPYCSLFFREN